MPCGKQESQSNPLNRDVPDQMKTVGETLFPATSSFWESAHSGVQVFNGHLKSSQVTQVSKGTPEITPAQGLLRGFLSERDGQGQTVRFGAVSKQWTHMNASSSA